MPIQFPNVITVRSLLSLDQVGLARSAHGEVILGMVTSVTSEGQANIRFGNFEIQADSEGLLQTGMQVFAGVQKGAEETTLALLPGLKEGEILSGSIIRSDSSEALVRFGSSEIRVRLFSTGRPAPETGTPVRVQIQLTGGRPVFQALPVETSEPTFTGTVIAAKPEGRILLDVSGTILMAFSAEQLEAGAPVQTRMLRKREKVTLQIVGRSPGQAGTTQTSRQAGALERFLEMPKYAQFLGGPASGKYRIDSAIRELVLLLQQTEENADRSDWISALMQTLRTVMLDPEKESLPDQLATAIRNSGVFLESRLLETSASSKTGPSVSDDLKLALLVAEQSFRVDHVSGKNAPGHLTDIAAGVNRALDVVTATQLNNLRLLPLNEHYIQLPFAGDSGIERVEMKISRHGRQGERKIDPRNVLLTLAVDTSNLGRIKTSLSIVDGQISCQFRAERESIVELVTRHADTLRRGFEALDYRVTHIGCMLCSDKRELSVLDDTSTIQTEGIDIRA